MRNIKIILVLFTTLSILTGCSSDSGDGKTINTVTFTTKAAVLSNNNLSITCGGIIASGYKDSSVCETGICYSTLPNPTLSNQVLSSFTPGNVLDFSVVIDNVIFGATYYVKAYIRNTSTGEVRYGNEVSVTVPNSLTTDVVKNISCSGFSVDVTVASSLSSNDERGICYSTSQNPTVSNEYFSDSTFGSGTFNITISNPVAGFAVIPGATYYLRSYVRVDSHYYYGNEVSFRVAGYIGGSGGYVFFDKGETTNGWRYLEAAPNYLVNSSNGNQYFRWNNCNGTSFLAGLFNDVGTGAENSVIIKNDCNFTTNAAAMAKYVSINGNNDWFLPSIDELKLLYTLKRENIISYNSSTYPLLSSSQQSNTTCWAYDFSNTGAQVGWSKTSDSRVWQARRF